MSQQAMRVFSTEFKQGVVLRLEAGERIAAVADELKIKRKLLHEWRAAYRAMGVAGLNRKRGPKKGFSAARAGSDAAPAPDAPSELARAKARIAELERKVGKQQMDLDFFREALRLIDALEAKTLAARTSATSSTRSSKR
jgi:transposase